MLSPEFMDGIVEAVSAEVCKENPTEECPMFVEGVLRQGLPLLAAAADDAGFTQVLLGGKVLFEKGTFGEKAIIFLNLVFMGIFVELR